MTDLPLEWFALEFSFVPALMGRLKICKVIELVSSHSTDGLKVLVAEFQVFLRLCQEQLRSSCSTLPKNCLCDLRKTFILSLCIECFSALSTVSP